jgi:hypothetical protein
MNRYHLKFLQQIFLAIALLCFSVPGFAQPGKLELKSLEKLADKASEVNDVNLDGALLQFAATAMDKDKSGNPKVAQAKDVVKGLKGIYIKSFEFDGPNQYSQADVDAIRAQLTGPGWQRIVSNVNKRNKENSEIYLLKEGDKINGVVILVAEAKEFTVVNIVGTIDADKLGELGGHFGIPDEINDKTDKPKHKPSPQAKPDKDKKESTHEDDDEDQ